MTPAAGPNYHSVTAELNQKVQELLERLRPRLAGDLPWNLHALLSLICVVLSLFTSGGLVSAGAVLLGVVGLFHALDQEYANSWMAAVGVVGGVVITLFSALFRLIQL